MYMVERTVVDYDGKDAKEYWNFEYRKFQYYPTGTFSHEEAIKEFKSWFFDSTIKLIKLVVA